MDYNSGFSKANNAGIKIAEGKYLLLLNSDTEIIDNAITKTLAHHRVLEQTQKVGLSGCQILSYDGTLQYSSNKNFNGIKRLLQANAFWIFFVTRVLKKPVFENENRKEMHCHNHEVGWLGIPFAIINSNIVKGEGEFLDEDFFMYAEDVEWNYRLKQKGYHHFFFSGASIYHINSGSSDFKERRFAQILISQWLFIYKAHGLFYYLAYISLLRFNCLLDDWFYNPNHINIAGQHSALIRKITWSLLEKYSLYILKNYSRKLSSGKASLKYEEQD
jgi:GT2 family glycosyltransferase